MLLREDRIYPCQFISIMLSELVSTTLEVKHGDLQPTTDHHHFFVTVGNLPKRYIRNVPLPRVPQGQSTRQSQVLPNTIPHYYEDAYAIPTYKDTCRIEERLATANSPQWQPIAINS